MRRNEDYITISLRADVPQTVCAFTVKRPVGRLLMSIMTVVSSAGCVSTRRPCGPTTSSSVMRQPHSTSTRPLAGLGCSRISVPTLSGASIPSRLTKMAVNDVSCVMTNRRGLSCRSWKRTYDEPTTEVGQKRGKSTFNFRLSLHLIF